MKSNLVKMLRQNFTDSFVTDFPFTVINVYAKERKKAANKIEELEEEIRQLKAIHNKSKGNA